MLRWFHVEPQGVDPCVYVPGLYTQAEVDDLINIDGYIPVADADEFAKIRTGAVETMGGCSIWAGSYMTGGDKQYIQIVDLDFTAFGTWTTSNLIVGASAFIYDGNEFEIANITATREIFTGQGIYRNIRIESGTFTKDTNTNFGGIIDQFLGGSMVNCWVSNSSITGMTGGSVGGLVSTATGNATITNCKSVNNTITTTATNATGGIVGYLDSGTGITVSDCKNTSTISGAGYVGGICGNASFFGYQPHTITRCINQGNISGTVRVGGILGLGGFESMSECKNTGNVSGTSMVGGIIGNLENTSVTFSTLLNLQSTGLITNSGTGETGGLIGRVRWTGNILTNNYAACTFAGSTTLLGGLVGRVFTGTVTTSASYWDTTIGPATSPAGTGQTTVALQTPTSNTGIYSAWTIPPWDFGTDTEYPSLTTTP